ncbi:bifunctional 2',3'-cyclic-nucleotide 2'-phosphodiesterase/3'-nucleotidase [Catenovulum sp. SM1970]|nr:bifunctional 2',3'-cyclic-nucleotide 2'-phosphodiesterase/3'-nucleotidase [Marinifaba aquimaris]
MVNNAEQKLDALALSDALDDLATILDAEHFASLRLMETTDVHAYITDVNYYSGNEQTRFGFTRTASLIHQARAEVANSILVDNGDLIQGNPMGDWMRAKGIEAGEVHPMYLAMNELGYDVGTYGNHEYNYGLAFLEESVNDANFPYINANVYVDDGDNDSSNDQLYYNPYIILDKTITGHNGESLDIKIGLIGFVTPQIMIWDKQHLAGKIIVKDIKASAEKYIPMMKAEGADIIVAVPHSGLDTSPYDVEAKAEQSSYYVSQVADVDAILFGHQHAVFPSAAFANLPNVDIEQGTINGVPSVMAGYWGSHLGIIDLELAYDTDNDSWTVFNHHVSVPSVNSEEVMADEQVTALLTDADQATRDYMNQPIGSASDDMFSFLALVQDDPSVQIVSDAQKQYVESLIENDPELKDIPVLSAAAPFKACSRGQNCSNESDFVTVEKGELALKDAADLYLYPNILQVLKVSGEQLKQWLECSAGMFNQVDPNSSEQQELVSIQFPTYNFDVIDGVEYQIDVTSAARYENGCKLVDESAERIKNLTYQGQAVTDDMTFLIASNNYRAGGGGNFPGTGGDHVVIKAPDANRDVLANYIRQLSTTNGTVNPTADNNWSFAQIDTEAELNVVFRVPDTERVANFVAEKQQKPMVKTATDERGAIYKIDLTQ